MLARSHPRIRVAAFATSSSNGCDSRVRENAVATSSVLESRSRRSRFLACRSTIPKQTPSTRPMATAAERILSGRLRPAMTSRSPVELRPGPKGAARSRQSAPISLPKKPAASRSRASSRNRWGISIEAAPSAFGHARPLRSSFIDAAPLSREFRGNFGQPPVEEGDRIDGVERRFEQSFGQMESPPAGLRTRKPGNFGPAHPSGFHCRRHFAPP